MNKELNILHIEDSADDAALTSYSLKRAGMICKIEVVQSAGEFTTALHRFAPDLILSDHSLPGFNSIAAYRIMQQLRPGTPFILLTGSVSEQFAVDCLVAGIDDYILKSNLIRLPSSIERVLSKKQISREKEMIQNLHTQLKSAFGQIETKNKEITDSITYAKRIQDAILPHDDEFCKEFSDCFLIYRPRDIVSGDLYWLARTTTTDGRGLTLKVFAAIDCTGHGVPGAFMSLLVSELLNQTLKNPDINSPGDVLSYLNRQLPASLNKNNKERITDGLDIALCALDAPGRILYYAGANRPLWILRRSGSAGELLEYKATKASIGDHTSPVQEFETLTIPLLPGDRVFLFSDGITDQFGGDRGRKLGRQALREALLNSASLSVSGQKQYLENMLTNWQGNVNQVDDMLLICIQVD